MGDATEFKEVACPKCGFPTWVEDGCCEACWENPIINLAPARARKLLKIVNDAREIVGQARSLLKNLDKNQRQEPQFIPLLLQYHYRDKKEDPPGAPWFPIRFDFMLWNEDICACTNCCMTTQRGGTTVMP